MMPQVDACRILAALAEHGRGMWSVEKKLAAATLAGACLMVATPAVSQDICIVCEEPKATYRCAPQDGSVRAGDVRLAFSCITELARTGGHSSCGVSRKQAGPCDGPLRTVSVIGPELPVVMGRPPEADAGGIPASPVPPPVPAKAEKKPGPPDTVVELAKRTADSSKEQLKKAGDGVTGAAKKSWRCLTSFFKEC